jgi:Gem-associated protein 7 (Gemin7)
MTSTVAEQQTQRTFLRERFLRLLTAINGQPAEFTMYNNQKVSAHFVASDIDVLHFQVRHMFQIIILLKIEPVLVFDRLEVVFVMAQNIVSRKLCLNCRNMTQ